MNDNKTGSVAPKYEAWLCKIQAKRKRRYRNKSSFVVLKTQAVLLPNKLPAALPRPMPLLFEIEEKEEERELVVVRVRPVRRFGIAMPVRGST